MTNIAHERIEICVENKVKQLAERNIELSNAQFDKFLEVCDAQHTLPTRLKQAANLLDQEGF